MSHVLHKYKLNCLSSWAPALRPAEFWASPREAGRERECGRRQSPCCSCRVGETPERGREAAGSAPALPAQEHSSVKYSAFLLLRHSLGFPLFMSYFNNVHINLCKK